MRRILASVFATATLIACSGATFPEPTGDAGADGAVGDAASDGGFPGACTEAGSFPGFVKGCTNTPSCVSKLHQIDCCGTMAAIGINHSDSAAFDAAEAAWEASCPRCKCPPGPTVAEDGKTGLNIDVKINCESQTCKTSF